VALRALLGRLRLGEQPLRRRVRGHAGLRLVPAADVGPVRDGARDRATTPAPTTPTATRRRSTTATRARPAATPAPSRTRDPAAARS
jgi:hypothetical protein